MRIGFYSNSPHIPSGYGQQCAQVIERMAKDGHEVAVMSNHGAAVQMMWNNIPIFPDGLRQYSVDLFPQQLAGWGGISIGLFDAWVLVPVAEQLRTLKLAWWVPIDHEPIPPLVAEFIAKSGCVAIAMSQHGEKCLLDVGIPRENVVYIPHAIDTRNLFVDKGRQARKDMGIPEDAHLTIMNAANRGKQPIRKAFAQNLEAIVRHLNKHEDAYAYIHTEPLGLSDGMNLPRYLGYLKAPAERIRWAEPIAYRNGIPTEHLPLIYSAGDVLLATSMGEGFGVPTIESQACGTPVIVSDWAASAELCGPYGTKIGGQRDWDEHQGAWWINPDIDQIAAALENNYHQTKAGLVDRTAVRRFALNFDADDVYEAKWKPLIAMLHQRPAPGQTAQPSRAQRRAAQRRK
jgi:glycosyltransferase involved in cell wall biosynthesis